MIQYRKAKFDDISQITSLMHQGLEESIAASQGDLIHFDDFSINDPFIKSLLDLKTGLIYIAENNDIIIGCIVAYKEKQPENCPFFRQFKRICIESLDIDIKWKSKGIGTRLIKEVEIWAKKHGYNEIFLEVYAKNKNAIDLYDNLDYALLKEKRRKYLE